MCPYFINYLRWVFPVAFTLTGEHVVYNEIPYFDGRELFRRLVADYDYLGEEYYSSRRVRAIDKLVEVCQDEAEFLWKSRQEITELAFERGFEARIKRIFLVMDDEINDWYCYLVWKNIYQLKLIVLKYVTETYRALLPSSNLVAVMKSFVERHRDEFIKRCEQQQTELDEIYRELDWPAERDKFLSNDPEFKKVLLNRLNANGKSHLLEYLLGADLGL
ncbi:hypothetical protein MYW52_25635 [Pseudomonas juntendi]|uniref:hypothetical protein n=1 Tax=Pseudomonas juntendi TaxID=2666183 RepID=UPI001FFCF180|nr:hypothetical protein [Pseudomonas juntendi]MCK2118860.1 hypothetical protein [Pseudomonas juntendi]